MLSITMPYGRMRNLDTSLLRMFVTVAEKTSMTASACALHLTQGAVSQKIGRLGALAGGKLMTRERRGPALTPAGQRLLGKARRMLALNDEIWSDMQGDAIAGPVRLGLPVDLVGPLFVPLLKDFLAAFPKVDLQLCCGSSDELRQGLAEGRLDLAVLEELASKATGERLGIDRLVWIGKAGGTAYLRDPLPISLVSSMCAFRPAILHAIDQVGRNARTVFENGGLDATLATIRMDIAVSAWLASAVPVDLDVLGEEAGLPELPSYAITLHGASNVSCLAAKELAHHVRTGLKIQHVA